MGLKTHLVNGIVSTVISVVATVATADSDSYDRSDMLLAVAVSAFLSGFFTSYFAK
jgi:flagellar motor component MotA